MGNKHTTLDDILAEDMHHWYNKFMRESPSGLITLFELKSMLGLQGMPEDANAYVDQVFYTFDMDGDGNGKIDKEELETIFTAIQDITQNHSIVPEEIVALIFEKIDVNGEGELTLEEFIEGARGHPDIMEMLKKMMDLTPVLKIIVEGRQKPDSCEHGQA
ncbi:guanylate cyclase activator 1d isoform X2 [Silurus meridionalis]|uniref:guanylate cyclase activator 1d isoform X2 n=1 Tax=Silurus meridionalis TaxID=175797 RepID=UPI001EEA8512|nr:guanylate cyclase activator 1d isoform X2 [Silurus meridionalis]